MNLFFLSETLLFRGTTQKEAAAMLKCLGGYTRQYEKGAMVYHEGQCIQNLGLVLSGSVSMERDDLWGNKSIFGRADAGQIFAETYACIPGEPMMANVVAGAKSEILFLNASKLLTTCQNSCTYHNRLIENLLQISARKNLELSRRILHTSAKTIRARLLSYLSEQAKRCGSDQFSIPFNRQQLADYLSVDRSALSNELSKMQRDGILTCEKNTFHLRRSAEGTEAAAGRRAAP